MAFDILLPEDILIAGRTIYGEARGEPYLGQKAIAHVLVNRWKFKTGDADHTLAAAALRWLQFSAWNEGDPNRERLAHADFMDVQYRQACRAILEAIDEPDFTSNARWYHTIESTPRWAQGKYPCYLVGKHLFYNDID